MGVRLKKHGRPNSDINVTPLVDVVLVLLIIFMVLTPLLEKELPIRLPENKTDEEVLPDDTTPQYVLTVKADGTLTLNGESIAEPDLRAKVGEVFQNRGDRVLFFDAEDAANYARAVQVLDLVRGAGARVIGFMTVRPEAR